MTPAINDTFTHNGQKKKKKKKSNKHASSGIEILFPQPLKQKLKIAKKITTKCNSKRKLFKLT